MKRVLERTSNSGRVFRLLRLEAVQRVLACRHRILEQPL
jgi:hypothetical protein